MGFLDLRNNAVRYACLSFPPKSWRSFFYLPPGSSFLSFIFKACESISTGDKPLIGSSTHGSKIRQNNHREDRNVALAFGGVRQATAAVERRGDARERQQQAAVTGPHPRKINLISWGPLAHVSDIKLIRTDTTLDLSQKAEKGMSFF